MYITTIKNLKNPFTTQTKFKNEENIKINWLKKRKEMIKWL